MDKTTEQTTKTATAKPALTAEEKRAKRNEYARAYYQAHKEKLIEAVRRCQAKKKTAAKKTVKKDVKKTTAKKAAPKGKALHAIAPVKKARPTSAEKLVVKLQAKLVKAQTKLAAVQTEIKGLKEQVKAAKLAAKAVRAATAK